VVPQILKTSPHLVASSAPCYVRLLAVNFNMNLSLLLVVNKIK
jgi:hypothetical protein